MKKKNYFLLLYLIITLFLSGCVQIRQITEQYIKTTIEIHNPKEFSSIKLYHVYKGFTNQSENSYIELTGYKYKGNKKLVIAADKYYKARSKFLGDNTKIAEIEFIELDIEQCKSIVNNYKILLEKLKTEKPKKNEIIYQDYTVSEDLFISYSKSKKYGTPIILNLWIKGKKFSIDTNQIIKKFEKFINY